MTEEISADQYSLKADAASKVAAPDLPYRPRDPVHYRPTIGLIACGGITQWHLTAYRAAGYRVAALCDLIKERAEGRKAEFYPDADVYVDYRELLDRGDIDVVDIATHPQDRVPLIEDALKAGKHVLSQKPFVLDLATGESLVALAREQNRKLAVNQNGRWAPHFSYIRNAVQAGLIGDVISAHFGVHWDHSWTAGTPFENIRDLVLYDFAIHWFDMAAQVLGDREATRIYATKTHATGQTPRPPLLAQAMIEFPGGQASLRFDAAVKYGSLDTTYIAGTKGTITSSGPDLSSQTVTLTTDAGSATPELEGQWFPDGFHGTMGELLCAIEEDREPLNSARSNLKSLALCYAAIAASEEGVPKRPGEVRRLPKGSAPGTD